MVHLTKLIAISAIVIAPAFAAPLQFAQEDIDLIARDPGFFGNIGRAVKSAVRRVAPVVNQVRNVVRKVAPIAAMVPGPIGAVGAVASAVARRDVEDSLYARAVQDELAARGYDIQVDVRDVQGLDARDVSEILETRDNIYTFAAREFIDSMEMEARRELSDDLDARQLAVSSFDELD